MMKFYCTYSGKEIEKLQYWSDPQFNIEHSGRVFYYCDATCSTEHYEQRKDNKNE